MAYPFVACGTLTTKIGDRATHGIQNGTGQKSRSGSLEEIFCWDPFFNDHFSQGFWPNSFSWGFLFNMFNHHGPWVGKEPPRRNGIPNSQDWTYVDFSRVLWKRKRNSWLDPPQKTSIDKKKKLIIWNVSHIKKRVDFTAFAMLVPGWLYDPLQVAQRSQVQNLPTQRFEKCPPNPMLPRRSPR